MTACLHPGVGPWFLLALSVRSSLDLLPIRPGTPQGHPSLTNLSIQGLWSHNGLFSMPSHDWWHGKMHHVFLTWNANNLTHVCVHVHAHACVCASVCVVNVCVMYAYEYMCVKVRGYCPSVLFNHFPLYWGTASYWAQSSAIQLIYLANLLRGYSVSASPVLALSGLPQLPNFYVDAVDPMTSPQSWMARAL